MARRILDEGLVEKLARRLSRPESAIGVLVSKKAAKHGISSEAALVVLAKEHNIGTTVYQRKLDASKQDQIQTLLRTRSDVVPPARVSRPTKSRMTPKAVREKAALKLAIQLLIKDPILKDRCADILTASSKFDRPINQATQILEDRIRKKAQPTHPMVGEPLVGFAFNVDLDKTVLRVASKDPEDQRGLTRILQGFVPAFRNTTHHHIVERFSRADALSICGLVDLLLRAVDESEKIR